MKLRILAIVAILRRGQSEFKSVQCKVPRTFAQVVVRSCANRYIQGVTCQFVVLTTTLGLAVSVKAENPIHFRRLLATKICIECDLKEADLRGADLSGATLRGAKLGKAKLAGANLSYANLIDANLKKADLTNANLTGAILKDTNLEGAILTGTTLFNGKRYNRRPEKMLPSMPSMLLGP